MALAVLGIATIAGQAAAAGLIDGTFGNTVTVSTADGTVLQSFFFNEDGTVSMSAADGETGEGTWTLEGSTLCLYYPEGSNCNEIEEMGIGKTMEADDGQGHPLVITVVEGR